MRGDPRGTIGNEPILQCLRIVAGIGKSDDSSVAVSSGAEWCELQRAVSHQFRENRTACGRDFDRGKAQFAAVIEHEGTAVAYRVNPRSVDNGRLALVLGVGSYCMRRQAGGKDKDPRRPVYASAIARVTGAKARAVWIASACLPVTFVMHGHLRRPCLLRRSA